MSRARYFHWLLLSFLLLGTVSCAHDGYVYRSRWARQAFQNGNFEKAIQWYQTQNPPERDRLLYLMDEGLILHTAGRFQESLDVFKKAIELSEKMDHSQVISKTAAVVINDNLIPYKGEQFEKLLLHLFQAMNYLELEEGNEALVEVRRIFTKFPDFFRPVAKSYLQNAFASYLSALVWESQGNRNDAYIDYKTTYRIHPDFAQLSQDLLKGARLLGFLGEYAKWEKIFGKSYQPLPRGYGEAVLLIQEGIVPEKESSEEEAGFQIVPVPVYPSTEGKPVTVTVSVNEKKMEKSYPLFRPDVAAKETLADQKPEIIARAVARLAAKEAGAVVVGKEVDKNLGFFLGLLALTTNRADLRSWLTLPRSLQVARLSLPVGTYDLRLTWPGGSHTLNGVQVKAGRKSFVSYRIF